MTTLLSSTTGPYRLGTKVVATRDLPGVPERTPGRITAVNGVTWARYWVKFDNGCWIGSIDHADVVPAGEYEDFKKRQVEEARRAEEQAAAGPATEEAAGAEPAASGAASRIPAHLLERSRSARERLKGGE